MADLERRRRRPVIALVLALTGCTPIASGPLPPRPAQPPPATTVAPVTTTTPVTLAAEEVAPIPDCPTAFCLIYHINTGATWSDGSSVTADDLVHTAAVHQETSSSDSTSPYSAVSRVEAIDEHTAMVVFDEPHGAWLTLFDRVIRSGKRMGDIEDLDTTGPFSVGEWAEGEYLTLERDPVWWADEDPLSGEQFGDVRQITFVFGATVDEMVTGLEDGAIDVISTRPDIAAVERLAEMDEVEHTVAPGAFWEHIDFNHDDPILSRPWARQAISLAIDREKILDNTVRLMDPGAKTLDNTVWMTDTPNYDPHFDDGFDPERASRILADKGCSRGEDGIHLCGGVRMSFKWASTNDDPARRETFESVQEDLETVGIEIVGEFRSPSDFVTRDFLFGGPDRWQLINFSWRSRPDPIGANPTYFCGDAGELNVNRYCSEEVEDLIRSTETMVHTAGRAAVYNRADLLYLGNRALIPLYQKPSLMAWTSELDGPEPNHTLSGDLWNVGSWSGKEEIVVALPAEPAEIDPLSREDDNANIILGALMYGAYGMDPSHEQLPVLVDSVEMVTDDNR